jgi:Toprim-like
MRGPAYRGFSPNGRKALFRLPGSHGVITRLAVFEAPIDAISLAVIERIRTNTLYIATGGGMGPETIEAMNDLLAELAPQACARVVVATGADPAGERYASRLQTMAIAASVPYERRAPPDGYKDWNQFSQVKAGSAGQ